MDEKYILKEAKRVFNTEINALEKTRDALDDSFVQILTLILECEGKIIFTGMGKPGHIASKLAATFASLGIPSFRLDPAEAMHGDLGMISENDIVIAISYSGESDEIVQIIPNIKLIGAKLIAITGNSESVLAREADYIQILPKFEEACHLGLAPTSSTTAVLCYGDALAVVASILSGFASVDFGKFHPAGLLGKKLIVRVERLMARNEDNAVIHSEMSLKDAIVEISKKGLGIVNVVDEEGHLLGVITDGDLRRQLEKGANIYDMVVEDVMSKTPTVISPDKLAVEAMKLMKNKNISCLPVVEGGKCIGVIRLQDIIQAGIIL